MGCDPGVPVAAGIHRGQRDRRRGPEYTWVGAARHAFSDRFAWFASYEAKERDCRATGLFRGLLAELAQGTEEDDR